MKVLAIGAHPDDIEIFMYGFIALCKKRGDDINLAIASDGAAGNIIGKTNLKKIREKESIKGLFSLGIPTFLNLPDGELNNDIKAKIVVKNFIKDKSPDLILTHSPDDYHPDHRALSRFVTDGVGFNCPVLFADTLMGVGFFPDFYIDITSVFKEKKEAILKHKSQRPFKFFQATKLLNRFRAAQCNAPEGEYAETYKSFKTFPFSDIREFLPNTLKYRPYYKSQSEGFI